MSKRLELVFGDITKERTDAIVNSANETLLGGGGVDGAIHRAAGLELIIECKTLSGCKPGDAKISKGYLLLAKHVIHTVGPRWNGGKHNEKNILKSCYSRCFDVAIENGLTSISFPAISCGVFGFPTDNAVEIAVQEIKHAMSRSPQIELVRVVVQDFLVWRAYCAAFGTPSNILSFAAAKFRLSETILEL